MGGRDARGFISTSTTETPGAAPRQAALQSGQAAADDRDSVEGIAAAADGTGQERSLGTGAVYRSSCPATARIAERWGGKRREPPRAAERSGYSTVMLMTPSRCGETTGAVVVIKEQFSSVRP